jgi:hypothetical protein
LKVFLCIASSSRITNRCQVVLEPTSPYLLSHIAGCLGSKVIVAINKDKEANILNVAHFGVVADYRESHACSDRKIKGAKIKISHRFATTAG